MIRIQDAVHLPVAAQGFLVQIPQAEFVQNATVPAVFHPLGDHASHLFIRQGEVAFVLPAVGIVVG